MSTIKSVDEYIAQAPAEMQDRLQELRATIRAAVPDAQERISLGRPTLQFAELAV